MKQLGELLVRDYMTEQAIVVDDEARLVDAIRLMDEKQVSVLPVVNSKGEMVGILSNSDLIQITHEIQSDLNALHHVNEKTQKFLIRLLMDQGDNTRVLDVMTTPVDVVAPDTNLIVAARKLADRQHHHLPVVDANNATIGILATSDFVRAIAEHGALAAG